MKTMKTIFSVVLISLTITFFVPFFSFANNDILDQKPGITPDNPLYFLDLSIEKIELLLTSSTISEAKKYLKFAEERLAEAEVMLNKLKEEQAEKALSRYESDFEKAVEKLKQAKNEGKNIEELAELLTRQVLKQQAVLEELSEKMPEEAKISISQTIEASKRSYENTLAILDQTKRKEILEKVKEQVEKVIKKETFEKIKSRISELKETPKNETEKKGCSCQ